MTASLPTATRTLVDEAVAVRRDVRHLAGGNGLLQHRVDRAAVDPYTHLFSPLVGAAELGRHGLLPGRRPVKNIDGTLGATNRSEAVSLARRKGLLG